MKVCERPGCNTPLSTGKHYCSRACAAKDRVRVKRLNDVRGSLSSSALSLGVPDIVMTKLAAGLGKKAAVELIEGMAFTFEDGKVKDPPLLSSLTEGNNLDTDPYYYGTMTGKQESYRPSDAVSMDRIEAMHNCGQVVFGLEMKKSWIRSALRDDRSWDIECADEKMQEVVHAMMQRVLEQHVGDFMFALDYGAYFGEKIWDRQPAAYWGIETEGNYIGYKEIAPVDPATVTRILYLDKGHSFAGYVQTSKYHGTDIEVPPDLALVLPYDMRFRNLWGRSALESVYPLWVWYEIALRSWMRYLERMGTPVTVGYGPSRGQIRDQDGNSVRTMKYAFLMAGNAAKSNAIALPSDIDPDTGQQLWKLEYLAAPDKAPQFQDAVRILGTQIVRALVIGDRTAEQPIGETGSYSSSQVHFAVTMLHNEHVLGQFLKGFNSWVIPQIVQYNGSASTPPARIVTESLDPEEKTRLFGLLNTMGNVADSSAMKAIDWRKIFAINNIPTLSEEEVKQLEKEALDRQEEQMAMASKFKEPSPTRDQQKVGDTTKVDPQLKEKIAASSDGVLNYLVNGGEVPVVLSSPEAQEWLDRMGDRKFTIQLYNPNHDAMGRFATKAAAVGGAFFTSITESAKAMVHDPLFIASVATLAGAGVAGEAKYTWKEKARMKLKAEEAHNNVPSEYRNPEARVNIHRSMGTYLLSGRGDPKIPITLGFVNRLGSKNVHISPKTARWLANTDDTPEAQKRREVAEAVVAHESIHSRQRNRIDTMPNRMVNISLEEGMTELLVEAKAGYPSGSGYRKYSDGMAKIASTVAGRKGAVDWVDKTHKNLDGVFSIAKQLREATGEKVNAWDVLNYVKGGEGKLVELIGDPAGYSRSLTAKYITHGSRGDYESDTKFYQILTGAVEATAAWNVYRKVSGALLGATIDALSELAGMRTIEIPNIGTLPLEDTIELEDDIVAGDPLQVIMNMPVDVLRDIMQAARYIAPEYGLSTDEFEQEMMRSTDWYFIQDDEDESD